MAPAVLSSSAPMSSSPPAELSENGPLPTAPTDASATTGAPHVNGVSVPTKGGAVTSAEHEHDANDTAVPAKPLEGEELRVALLKQLEYYFSRENLSTDSFLVSNMRTDFYVPLDIVASFKLVKALTKDIQLIVDVLRTSSQVTVDPTGKMVKPNHRNIIMLRDISADVPEADIREIFAGEGCAPIRSLRSDIGETWFVTFDSEEAAVNTLFVIRQRKFRNQKVEACIKSESLLRSGVNSRDRSAGSLLPGGGLVPGSKSVPPAAPATLAGSAQTNGIPTFGSIDYNIETAIASQGTDYGNIYMTSNGMQMYGQGGRMGTWGLTNYMYQQSYVDGQGDYSNNIAGMNGAGPAGSQNQAIGAPSINTGTATTAPTGNVAHQKGRSSSDRRSRNSGSRGNNVGGSGGPQQQSHAPNGIAPSGIPLSNTSGRQQSQNRTPRGEGGEQAHPGKGTKQQPQPQANQAPHSRHASGGSMQFLGQAPQQAPAGMPLPPQPQSQGGQPHGRRHHHQPHQQQQQQQQASPVVLNQMHPFSQAIPSAFQPPHLPAPAIGQMAHLPHPHALPQPGQQPMHHANQQHGPGGSRYNQRRKGPGAQHSAHGGQRGTAPSTQTAPAPAPIGLDAFPPLPNAVVGGDRPAASATNAIPQKSYSVVANTEPKPADAQKIESKPATAHTTNVANGGVIQTTTTTTTPATNDKSPKSNKGANGNAPGHGPNSRNNQNRAERTDVGGEQQHQSTSPSVFIPTATDTTSNDNSTQPAAPKPMSYAQILKTKAKVPEKQLVALDSDQPIKSEEMITGSSSPPTTLSTPTASESGSASVTPTFAEGTKMMKVNGAAA